MRASSPPFPRAVDASGGRIVGVKTEKGACCGQQTAAQMKTHTTHTNTHRPPQPPLVLHDKAAPQPANQAGPHPHSS